MIRTLNPRQRYLVIGAAVAIGLLLADRLLIGPLNDAWTARSAEISQLRRSISEGKDLLARGDQLRTTWTELQSATLAKDPSEAEHEVITALDGAGRSSGVEIGALRPQWKRGASEKYSLLECRIEASGDYPALSRFLYAVEKAPLALRVEALDLTSRDEGGQKLSLLLNVTGLRLAPLEARR